MLGERSFIMIIPYTILMLVYALFYKKFTWWKVALTTYLAGILLENAMNRSPIQAPTLLWVAFFTYPYFFTKIFENRRKINWLKVLKDFKWTIISSLILISLSMLVSRNTSPPLIIFGAALPFLVHALYWLYKKK